MKQEIIASMKNQMKPKQEIVDELFNKIKTLEQEEVNESRSALVRNKVWYSWNSRRTAFVAAALIICCILMLSPVGNAFAEQIKAWMQPKTVTEIIEGNDETTDLEPQGKMNSQDASSGYVIYVNSDFFQTELKDGVQIISALSESKANMTITAVEGMDYESCLQEAINKSKMEGYSEANPLDLTLANKGVYYTTGVKWNDQVTRIYCIDNGSQGCFLVKTENTVEEDEGYGSRFESMLNTLELVSTHSN